MITTSTGAKKIEGTDNWREIFDAHNDSVDAQDKLAPDMAPIVNGNKCVAGASAGDYVLVRNSSITGITDGAYIAAQAIPANTAIDSTYLTAISGGALNSLNSNCPEIVSNANGTAYKFPNGLLICTKVASGNSNITSQWGSMYESSVTISPGDWAVAFTDVPVVSITNGLASGYFIEMANVTKNTINNIYLVRPNSASDVPYKLHIVAFGMWK